MRYSVSVTFTSPVTGSRTDLDVPFEWEGMRVESSSLGHYSVTLAVDARDASEAAKVAERRVRDMLRMLAVLNYRFESGHAVSTSTQHEDRTEHGRVVVMRAVLAAERVPVEADLHALCLPEELEGPESERLRTALELNYLAVLGEERDARAAFLTYYTALEVLVEQRLGTNTTVLSALSRQQQKLLRAEVREVLQRAGLDERQVERLAAQLEGTKAESDVDRFVEAIAPCGLSVSREDVMRLRKSRGTAVHSGGVDALTSVATGMNMARTWVQAMLRSALSSDQR